MCLIAAAAIALPTSAQGQWVESPGSGWVSVTAYHHDTRSRYDWRGEDQLFFADGHAVTTSVYVTAALGVWPGVDLWAQAPVHRLRFDDISGDRSSTGIGDPRLWVRVAPLRLLGSSFPFAIRGGAKLPAGDFPIDAEVIPLGEGQRDWEVMLELGHSFYPAPLYAAGWVGYRWREPDEAQRDWGNETFFLAQVGGSLSRFGYKLIAEGWSGDTPVIEGVPTPNSRREYLQITPSLTVPLGPGQVEAGLRVPVLGKNLPTGSALVLGYFRSWSR